jgi:hypothetical protein
MTLCLTASTVPGATYSWTGPNGFTSTNQNPSITPATTNAAGVYNVAAIIGNCVSELGSTTVTANPPASVSIQCSSNGLVLTWPIGTLQSADELAGSWSDVPEATSPWTVATNAPQLFYRVRVQ